MRTCLNQMYKVKKTALLSVIYQLRNITGKRICEGSCLFIIIKESKPPFCVTTRCFFPTSSIRSHCELKRQISFSEGQSVLNALWLRDGLLGHISSLDNILKEVGFFFLWNPHSIPGHRAWFILHFANFNYTVPCYLMMSFTLPATIHPCWCLAFTEIQLFWISTLLSVWHLVISKQQLKKKSLSCAFPNSENLDTFRRNVISNKSMQINTSLQQKDLLLRLWSLFQKLRFWK